MTERSLERLPYKLREDIKKHTKDWDNFPMGGGGVSIFKNGLIRYKSLTLSYNEE